MIFFEALDLTKAAYSSSDLLKKIANNLTFADDSEHQEKKVRFMSSVEKYDHSQINEMLEEAMCNYLHVTFLPEGIERFCKKYNISIDFSSMTTEEIILAIDEQKPTFFNSI